MLYTNTNLETWELVINEDVKIPVVTLGEHGRGRKPINLPVPPGTEKIAAGPHEDLTIGTTKSGRPRINKGKGTEMYLLLDSKMGYTRRGDGTIRVWGEDEKNVKVLAAGNSADGDAGRIGQAAARVLQVFGPALIRIRYGGQGYFEYLFVYPGIPGKVQVLTEEAMELYDEAPLGWDNVDNYTTL